MKQEIRSRIIKIISITVFLILMTTLVYLPNHKNLVASLAFLNSEKEFYMEELSDAINMENSYPVYDEVGLNTTPYTFRVVNNSNKDIKFNIVFNTNEEEAKEVYHMEVLPNKYLRYSLTNNDIEKANTLPDNNILYTGTIKANSSETFNFKMWLNINSDSNAVNKILIGSIDINRLEK